MLRFAVVAGVLVVFGPGLAGAGDENWGRFRGPNGSGISNAKTIPVTWGENDYNWIVRLPGTGYSSPVVWGDRLYVSSGDEQSGERHLLCLNTADGTTRWQRNFQGTTYDQHRDNAYAAATPTADAQGVVFSWATPEHLVLLALDPDGGEMWRRDLGTYSGLHGPAVSPVIAGDLVVLPNDQMHPDWFGFTRGPPPKSFLIAVDRSTGKTRWTVKRKSSLAAYSMPCLHQYDGGEELIFTSTSHGITAVDPANGKVNWELPDIFTNRCVGSPISDAGLVFAGFGQGLTGDLFVAVRRGTDGKPPAIVYEVTQSAPLVPTALAKDGRLYLWRDQGIVSCLEVTTGKVIWRERVDGKYYGSPVWVDGRLYCMARNGDMVVLSAADSFKQLARISLGEPGSATPAVAGGVMYLRTKSRLFSLGAAARPDED